LGKSRLPERSNPVIYSITHDHENAIITLQLKGAMELNGFIRMLDEVGVKILQTQCYDLLVDVTNLSVRLALLDLNTLPGLMQATLRNHRIDPAALRRAVVLPRSRNVIELHQIFARTIGGNHKIFQNTEEAKRWLVEDNPKHPSTGN